ncbi:hypothetical protein GOP47_0002738 [Adiantum capillus-veneris]|uniref:Cysteine-rich transmembrane CYSTM domain-containing protein n=1 Tax=Adiantum capillus-veneris TaxID=13818 RepID=A0A9D4VAM9_ADICA|nr:hypothetical protein GOP47_0002738 [Adiantum capillus-veneris]
MEYANYSQAEGHLLPPIPPVVPPPPAPDPYHNNIIRDYPPNKPHEDTSSFWDFCFTAFCCCCLDERCL